MAKVKVHLVIKDKKGEPKYKFLSDWLCKGREDDTCGACKLFFKCYTGESVKIDITELPSVFVTLPSVFVTEEPTMNEVVMMYLTSQNVPKENLIKKG